MARLAAEYVIVGAGSAGAALAARLSAAGRSVILIEHGGSDRSVLIRMPSALSYPMNMRRYDWGYRAAPEPALGGRALACPRGKALGGSSSINGMVYVRGHPQDYAAWEAQGARGWGWAGVEPVFRRMEGWDAGGQGGDPALRGTDGPVKVSRGTLSNPLNWVFLDACAAAGFPRTEDYNGAQPEGAGPFDRSIWHGERWSAADAYLRPALKRPNLWLVRGLAQQVVFDGRRATGVALRRNGRDSVIEARREVILCAGAINSPKLLLQSGIGPAAHLRAVGVSPLLDRAGVGENLQDHLELYVQWRCLKPVTLNAAMNVVAKGVIGAQWMATRAGLGATNHFETGAFLKTRPDRDYADMQIHFLPGAFRYDGKGAVRGHGFQMHVGPMRSPSRGTIRLTGPDPRAAPAIRFNYMAHDEDWRDFRACIRIARRIVGQPPFEDWAGAEVAPGAGAGAEDDAALNAFIAEHAESAYHPCGACRMGDAEDPLAVVDPACRVIGVEGLRVADSAIFPRITYGNLNAPSMMVGEKAAQIILKE